MIQWTAELSRRLGCPRNEKEELLPVIKKLIDMALTFRESGMTALASMARDSGEPLLDAGIDLIAEGIAGEPLQDILATYLAVSPDSGYPFLKSCVIVEGIIGIADGEDVALLSRRLAAWFGAEDAMAILPETVAGRDWGEGTT